MVVEEISKSGKGGVGPLGKDLLEPGSGRELIPSCRLGKYCCCWERRTCLPSYYRVPVSHCDNQILVRVFWPELPEELRS